MLDDSHRALLYEVYQCTDMEEVYAAPGGNLGTLPIALGLTQSLRQRVDLAITKINQSEAKINRVSEILAEYKEISVDPSQIDREGYAFRFERSLNRIKELLFPYTGIVATGGGSNLINWG